MAPIKFDDDIKEKLEKRSLQPSNEAWQTLSNRLDAEQKKQSRSFFFYMGIAASIVGILFISIQFFNTTEELQTAPKMVDTETNTSNDKQDVLLMPEQTNDLVEISSQEDLQKHKETNIDTNKSNPTPKNKITIANISEEKSEIIVNKKEIEDFKVETSVAIVDSAIIKEKEATALNTLTLEDIKVQEVLNQIKQLDADGIAATDQEIDDLLKQAEKEILKERIYNETTRTVDAEALLQDVEADLEQSFRTKVFDALKSSYNTVKTAVAERNN